MFHLGFIVYLCLIRIYKLHFTLCIYKYLYNLWVTIDPSRDRKPFHIQWRYTNQYLLQEKCIDVTCCLCCKVPSFIYVNSVRCTGLQQVDNMSNLGTRMNTHLHTWLRSGRLSKPPKKIICKRIESNLWTIYPWKCRCHVLRRLVQADTGLLFASLAPCQWCKCRLAMARAASHLVCHANVWLEI